MHDTTLELHTCRGLQIGVNYNQVVRLLHFTSDKNVQNLLREPYKFTEEVKQLQQQAVESTEIDRNIWRNGHLRGFQPTKYPLRQN